MDGAQNFFFVRGESDDLAFGIEPRRVLEEARRSPPGCAIGSCVLNAAVVIHSSSHLPIMCSKVASNIIILKCDDADAVDRASPKSGECASILTWKARKQPIISNYIPSHASSGFFIPFTPQIGQIPAGSRLGSARRRNTGKE